MALKNHWTNKTDGVDDVLAEDINSIAESVIELERKEEERPKIEIDQNYSPISQNPQSGTAVSEAIQDKPNFSYLNNNFANAIKGVASGHNAVRIDDISPIPHNIKADLQAVNIINQEEFFATDKFKLPTEIGKTYILSCSIIEDAEVAGYTSGLAVYNADDEDDLIENFNFLTGESYEFTATEGLIYYWETLDDLLPSKFFSEVSMVLKEDDKEDVEGIKNLGNIKILGKNILDESWKKSNKWELTSSLRPKFVFELPANITATVSIELNAVGEKSNGNLRFYESTDGVTFKEIERLWEGTTIKSKTINTGYGYKYMLWASSETTRDLAINGIEILQIELGNESTELEPYQESENSVYPTTTIISDTQGVNITTEYNRDINKVITNLEKAILTI